MLVVRLFYLLWFFIPFQLLQWKVLLFQEEQSEKKLLSFLFKKWKWSENDSRSRSEMFREFSRNLEKWDFCENFVFQKQADGKIWRNVSREFGCIGNLTHWRFICLVRALYFSLVEQDTTALQKQQNNAIQIAIFLFNKSNRLKIPRIFPSV